MAVGLESIYVVKPSTTMDLIFKHRRSLLANRKSELVALMAISTTLFLFFHTRDLHTKLKEMEVKLQPDVSLSGHQLSGVLLTPTDVLTTCDCLSEIKGSDQRQPSAQTEEQNGIRIISPSILRIRTNELGSNNEPQSINVTEVRLHPKCDGFGGYDYAMVRLKSPARVQISLTENYFPFSRTYKGKYDSETDGEPECYVPTLLKERREWNDRSPFKYSGVSMIPVVVADTEECREFINYDPLYVRYDWANKICIEATKLLPICKGDLGVPLICNETLVGIVSANSAFCDWNSSLNVVSSLEGAWDFIDEFIKTGGFQYWKNKAQGVLNSIKELID